VAKASGVRASGGRAFGGFGFSSWKRKWSKLTWPQPPACRSTTRRKISFPLSRFTSNTTALSSSLSSPLAVKCTRLSAAPTISTQVVGCEPPETRKLAQRCVTLKGFDVSVPVAASPPTS
jgi:hypothetical protein